MKKDMDTAYISGSADFIQIPGGWPADQHGIPAVINEQRVHLVHDGVMEGPCDSLQQILFLRNCIYGQVVWQQQHGREAGGSRL